MCVCTLSTLIFFFVFAQCNAMNLLYELSLFIERFLLRAISLFWGIANENDAKIKGSVQT